MYFKAMDFEIENVGCKTEDALLAKCIVYSYTVKQCRNLILARTVNIWDIKNDIPKILLWQREAKGDCKEAEAPVSWQIHRLIRSPGFRPIITGFKPIFFVSPPVMYTSARLDT